MTDTSALRALGGAATRGSRWVYGGQGLVFANTDVVGAPYGEFRDLFASVQNDQDGVYLVALVNAAPALLDELDRLREARAMAWVIGLHAGIRYASLMGKPGFDEPTNPFLAIPAGPKAGE